MRSTACLALVAGILVSTTPAAADTEVGGLICTDTTWTLAGSPYIVTRDAGGSVVVGCDATLTVEAGVEVRFEPGLALLVGLRGFAPGTLIARGTEQAPIRFTSNQPVPPDVNRWSRLGFLDLAVDATFDDEGNYQSGCILEHVIVEYGGSGGYAAVSVDRSAPFLRRCEVGQNLKRGIHVSSSSLRIENCYVHHNQDSGIWFESSPGNTLTGNTIEDNTAGYYGGGISFASSPGNTLTGNTISANTAGNYGGGISFVSSPGNTLTGNTISANSAGSGAGIYFASSKSNTLTGNTITGNNGGNFGGGISFASRGSNTVSGNTISGNSARDAGGIYFASSPGNTLTGNAISDNSATRNGGGISFYGSGSNTLSANTIEGNTAGSEGGGIYLLTSHDNSFSASTVRFNHTTGGQTGGIYVTAQTERLSLNGGPQAYNTICCNDGYEVYNDNPFFGDGRHDIDARNVYWATRDPGVIQAGIYDFFDNSAKSVVFWNPYVWSPPAGDMNCDGAVNSLDIEGFILALFDPAGYAQRYPDCDINRADMNGDGQINSGDIEGFIAVLFE